MVRIVRSLLGQFTSTTTIGIAKSAVLTNRMKKWTRCTRCCAWLSPDVNNCKRCERSNAHGKETLPALGLSQHVHGNVSSGRSCGEEQTVLQSILPKVVAQTQAQSQERSKVRYELLERQVRQIACSVCGADFDPEAPRHREFGKYTECADCAGEDVTKLTGVMIIGGKNAMEIQINADPEVTRYMQSASTHHGTAPGVVANKKSGTVVKVVTGLENRRHGESK